MNTRQRIVLAYSGGLWATAVMPWLREHYDADVVTLTLDLGQGRELDRIRERALGAGAVRAHVLDVRDEFAREFILPALQAGAACDDRVPLATELGRLVIARTLIEVAELEQAAAVAHGCPPSGVTSIETTVRALNPELTVIAPAREWGMTRADAVEYARARGIALPAEGKGRWSVDQNLWGRTVEYAPHESAGEPSEDAYALTKSATDAPAEPAYIEVEFDAGVPVAVNGIAMGLSELIGSLETIAGVHGVGRLDTLEHAAGVTSRRVYEAPAATVLHAAHRELEALVIPGDLRRLERHLSIAYAEAVREGRWFTPARTALDAFVASVQQHVTGTVRLEVFKAQCRPVQIGLAATQHSTAIP